MAACRSSSSPQVGAAPMSRGSAPRSASGRSSHGLMASQMKCRRAAGVLNHVGPILVHDDRAADLDPRRGDHRGVQQLHGSPLHADVGVEQHHESPRGFGDPDVAARARAVVAVEPADPHEGPVAGEPVAGAVRAGDVHDGDRDRPDTRRRPARPASAGSTVRLLCATMATSTSEGKSVAIVRVPPVIERR